MKKDSASEIAAKIIEKTMMDIALETAPSGPARASHGPARLPGEPILYEKDGWGIYTPEDAKTQFTSGEMEGSCLTHIGCDCIFPYWSFSHLILRDHKTIYTISCSECQETITKETFTELVRVYRFVNNIQSTRDDWNI